MNSYYKIRDKNTGLFKNDNHRTGYTTLVDGFNQTGELWSSKKELQAFLNKWAAYPKKIAVAKRSNTMRPIPDTWEIVQYELVSMDSLTIAEFQHLKS